MRGRCLNLLADLCSADSMDSFRHHRGPRGDAGGRNIPQMLSSLVDAEFCDPICISYPSTKLPTE